MSRVARIYQSSVGRKLVVASTGLVLVLFLVGHMLGSLTVFQGPDTLNGYAAWLQGNPVLWVFRLALLAILVLHLVTVLLLARANRRARPVRYRTQAAVKVGVAPRWMLATGALLLVFLVYHLLHLTTGTVAPEVSRLMEPGGRPDVYGRVVASFGVPWITGVYLAGLTVLALHLHHAVGSLFQSLGVESDSWWGLPRVLPGLLTALIVGGFAAVPLSIALGLVGQRGAG